MRFGNDMITFEEFYEIQNNQPMSEEQQGP